jgi:ribose transport system permease protein
MKKQGAGEELSKKPLAGNQRLYALVAMVLIYILFSIFGRNFLSFETAVNILDASYYIGFLAIGVTFVIITVGSTFRSVRLPCAQP